MKSERIPPRILESNPIPATIKALVLAKEVISSGNLENTKGAFHTPMVKPAQNLKVDADKRKMTSGDCIVCTVVFHNSTIENEFLVFLTLVIREFICDKELLIVDNGFIIILLLFVVIIIRNHMKSNNIIHIVYSLQVNEKT